MSKAKRLRSTSAGSTAAPERVKIARAAEITGESRRTLQALAAAGRILGRGDYHWQHEPCWYAVRSRGHWTGDRKQTTLWSIPTGDQDAETEHATQKPVECMRRPILNNSNPGQSVYEPFLGSGTTLIAAEMTGRVCLAVELEPRYADVSVRRWQAFTGKPAVLESTGQRFDEVAAERGASAVGRQPNAPSERPPAGTGQIDTGA
jgi:hypothetical protein